MQVDSTPPFTSVAQAMGQTAQAPPPAASDGDADKTPDLSATPADGDVGTLVNITA
jgi:hypothetical protein